MNFEQLNQSELEEMKHNYADEVKARWGKTEAYAISQEKAGRYTKSDWQSITKEIDGIFQTFAANMDKKPDDPGVQAIVKQWQDLITKRFYPCNNKMLQELGAMYLKDGRFQQNMDKTAKGLASFVSEAIAVYCR